MSRNCNCKRQTWWLTGIAAIYLLGAFAGGTLRGEEDKQPNDGVDYLNIPFQTIDGETATLADWHGDVLLVVNTASRCGLTYQYEELQALYEEYAHRGFRVIGFPANNFLNQEPGTDEEIKQFCTTQYSVTFPMMSKISVKGEDKHPLYAYLTEQSPFAGEIRWNFDKFLLDREGEVVARFSPRTRPGSEEVVQRIEQLLTPSGEVQFR